MQTGSPGFRLRWSRQLRKLERSPWDGKIGDEFRELLRHAREVHDLMIERLRDAEPGAVEYARGLADSIGNHLYELEAALKRDLN